MHYYQFNIKDYSFATIRMTLMEDLAFRRMLDLFYESEKPLPFELKRIAKLIGMADQQEEIRDILNEFWQETEKGWVNSRAEVEIAKYQAKADSARANGKKGGRPSKPKITQSVNLANPEITGSKANHKPLTINQELNKDIVQQAELTPFDFWWERYPKKQAKCAAEKIFNKKIKGMSEERLNSFMDNICEHSTSSYKETEKSFIPMPTTYLNQERYNDE